MMCFEGKEQGLKEVETFKGWGVGIIGGERRMCQDPEVQLSLKDEQGCIGNTDLEM